MTKHTRRGFLLESAAAFRLMADEDRPVPSLAEAAAKCGIQYGATPEVDLRGTPQGYVDLLARHCKLIAPILSWAYVAKTPGAYDYSRQQATLDFVSAHKMKITGAHLLWHFQNPKWFDAVEDRSAAERLVREHILAIGRHFAGQVYSWNVVNEGLNPREGRPGGLRMTPYLAKFGPEYFDFAFHAAREADPHALLVYNDYNMEEDKPESESRRRALLGLLDGLKQRKVPVDAIGLQAHLNLADFRFQADLYRRFLKDVAARGVRILITELDVLDVAAPADTRDQAVADAYARVLDVALDERAVVGVVTWGLSDRFTWLTPRRGERYTRPDGLPNRPLPFDTDYQPKAAYWAILKSFEAAARKRAGS